MNSEVSESAAVDDCEQGENSSTLPWRRSKFHGYKESLFSFTIKQTTTTRSRGDLEDDEEAYDCRYKFNVHREKVVIEDPFYVKTTPSNLVSDDGDILLIIILQWDELFDNEKLIFTSVTRDRAFFIAFKENLMEDAVGDVISPIIHRLGITSPEEKERVTPERISTKIDEWATKESDRFFFGSDIAESKNKRKRTIADVEKDECCCSMK